MLDKIVKAFIAAAQAPTKSRERHAALDNAFLNGCGKALTFSPAIISYAR